MLWFGEASALRSRLEAAGFVVAEAAGRPLSPALLAMAGAMVCWKAWPDSLPRWRAPPLVLCLDRKQTRAIPTALRNRAAAIFVEPVCPEVFLHEMEDLLARGHQG